MREVVQIIKCDNCKNEVKDEQVTIHSLSIDSNEYEFELCGTCDDVAYAFSLSDIIDFSRLVKSKKSGKSKSKFPYRDEDIKITTDGAFLCPEDCGDIKETMRGLKMHWARAHG